MTALLAWAAIILRDHLLALYPVLLPGLLALLVWGLSLWRKRSGAQFLITALAICYLSYLICVLAGAFILAWQFSGGGGPLLPVTQLIVPTALVLALVWLMAQLGLFSSRRSGARDQEQ